MGDCSLLGNPCISAHTEIVSSCRCADWYTLIDSHAFIASVNTINTSALRFGDGTGGGNSSVIDLTVFSGNIGALGLDFLDLVLGDDSLLFEAPDSRFIRGNLQVPVSDSSCGCFTALVIKLTLDENFVAGVDVTNSVVNLLFDLNSEASNESCPVLNENFTESCSLLKSTLFTLVANV